MLRSKNYQYFKKFARNSKQKYRNLKNSKISKSLKNLKRKFQLPNNELTSSYQDMKEFC